VYDGGAPIRQRRTGGDDMKRKSLRALACVLGLATMVAAAPPRNWKSGVLTSMEQQKVNEGSTSTTNRDGQIKDKGNKTDYSSNSTTTTSDNIETYQMYTIESDKVVYIASEHLLFPWSKPANVNVGENIKYVVEKGKIIILDDDNKEHKATIVKTSMKQADSENGKPN
jgi:hypothetical protein